MFAWVAIYRIVATSLDIRPARAFTGTHSIVQPRASAGRYGKRTTSSVLDMVKVKKPYNIDPRLDRPKGRNWQ